MYVLHAVRRVKENAGLSRVDIRLPTHNLERDIYLLRDRIKREEGVWRIYRSVNRRDVYKTYLWMQHRMLDDTDNYYADSLDKLWTKGLMQPDNKAERLYLIDIDTENSRDKIDMIIFLGEEDIETVEMVDTPNGMHIIAKPFDVRLMEQFDFAEVKKDALLFIERIDNE